MAGESYSRAYGVSVDRLRSAGFPAQFSPFCRVGSWGHTGFWECASGTRRNDWNEAWLSDCSCCIKLECDLLPSGHGFLPHAVRAGGGYPVQTCPRATGDHPPDLVGETAGEPGGKPCATLPIPLSPAGIRSLPPHWDPVCIQSITPTGFSPEALAVREWPLFQPHFTLLRG